MKSLKTLIPKEDNKKGFSMIEILVVISIFFLVTGVGLFMSFDIFRGSNIHSEKDLIISLLEKARSESMNNLNEKVHGFCVKGSNYIVFEDGTCSTNTREEIYEKNSGISLTYSPTIPSEIIFDRLTGNPTWNGSISVSKDGKTAIISINSQGMIDWSI